jgi:hypothetical protein
MSRTTNALGLAPPSKDYLTCKTLQGLQDNGLALVETFEIPKAQGMKSLQGSPSFHSTSLQEMRLKEGSNYQAFRAKKLSYKQSQKMAADLAPVANLLNPDLDNLEVLSTRSETSTKPSSTQKKEEFLPKRGFEAFEPKHLTNLGAKLFYTLGPKGVHPLQMLCEQLVKNVIFAEILENKDVKTELLKKLDEGPACFYGYATWLKQLLTQSCNELKAIELSVLKIAWSEVLKPLEDPEELSLMLNQGTNNLNFTFQV